MSPAPLNHVVILGAMGSGKTTLGEALAASLLRPFCDSDAQLRSRGEDAEQLLAREGRDALHHAEAVAASEALERLRPAVIALAASVVDDAALRSTIAAAGFVIYLRADVQTLAGRIGSGVGRPIELPVPDTLRALDAPRRSSYEALADLVIDVDELAPTAVLERALGALRREIEVELGERSYSVLIGPGVRGQLERYLPPSARRVAIVTQPSIGIDLDLAIESATFTIGDGESAKSIATVEELCSGFSKFGLTRADVVVALGGGLVTDVAGFAASCYHRGVAYVNVSTTLLGQIDAAIGGKTGVNLPEGKNLLGAFWQPAAVLCDTDTLVTLPEREWRSGLGEMAKYAFLGVDELDSMTLIDEVAACVALKAAIVGEDEREGARRMLLNYGHTLAHVVEAAGFADGPGRDGIDLRHGEAVAIGVAFAARLAQVLGRIDEERVARHLEVLAAYGLPSALPAGVSIDEVLVWMARDKKATDGLTFVLDGAAGVDVVRNVDESAVRRAFDEMQRSEPVRASVA